MPHKLLLADDSVTIQRVIELTFADEDVQVISVGNGQQAIERAERDRPDIVLADVGMPERDGYEVAAFIKGNPTLSHIPVVLLTGAFEPIDESRARAVGCDGVLVKPFEPQMVISRVKELLAGRRPAGLWGGAPAAQGPVRAPAGQFDLRPSAASSTSGDPLEAYFDRLDAAFSAKGATPVETAASGQTPVAPPAPKREAIPLSKGTSSTADELASWDPELSGKIGRSEPSTPSAPGRPATDDLSTWDPELRGDSSRPAVVPKSAPAVASRPAAAAQTPPASVQTPPASAPAPAAAGAPALTSLSLVDAFAALLAAEQRTSIAPSAAPLRANVAADDRVIEEVTQRVLARLSDQVRPGILDVAERLVRDEIDRIKQNR